MEQKAPRIATFATVIAFFSTITLLFNAFAGKYPGHAGERILLLPLFKDLFADGVESYWGGTAWTLQETVWAIATFLLVMISFWGRQLRSIPELPKQPSVAEQLESFESISTPVSNNYSPSNNQRTSSIVSSILDTNEQQMSQQSVSSAITSLSSGSLGAYSSAVVAERNTTVSESTMETEQLDEETQIQLEIGLQINHTEEQREMGIPKLSDKEFANIAIGIVTAQREELEPQPDQQTQRQQAPQFTSQSFLGQGQHTKQKT